MSDRKIVIIGGGVIGLSVAYHLGKLNVDNVVLLERNQLTSGTSWHAAGIVGPLRSSANLTELARYSLELFTEIEDETGQSTGFTQTGGLWLANNSQRLVELRRMAAMGHMHDIRTCMLSADEVKEKLNLLHTADIKGAMWVANDGQINPVDLCMAYAKGAKSHGVEIREHSAVTHIEHRLNKVDSIMLDDGNTIPVRCLINCAGLWAREIGLMCHTGVPLRAVEHMYMITDTVPELSTHTPIVRDLDNTIYIKSDTGKLVIGTFESNAKIWQADSMDKNTSFIQLDEDWSHAQPMLEAALHRLPMLAHLGIQQLFTGPESFTPDTRQIMGRAPDVENVYVAAGFNSIGIVSSAGAGKAMAHWVINQHPPMDLWDVDIQRFENGDNHESFLNERIPEAVHNQFAMHWPFKEFATGRKRKQSVWHHLLEKQGAVFGALAGWERPLWFAQNDEEREFSYSHKAQCWWPYAQREAKCLEKYGAVFDVSALAKLTITGSNALKQLQYLSSRNLDVPIGRVVYTLMLNANAAIEADCTITRLSHNKFMVVCGAAIRIKMRSWIRRQCGDTCQINDITDDYGVVSIMGPNSIALLNRLNQHKTSLADVKYGLSCPISINGHSIMAYRISYVGEAGFELFIPISCGVEVMRAIIAEMPNFSMTFAGHFCMDSCRLEKNYVHWGHDVGCEDTPISADLMFAVSHNDDFDFLGKKQLNKLFASPSNIKRKLFEVIADSPLLLHDEPIYINGKLAGRSTSGGLGFRCNKALSMGYINMQNDLDTAEIEIDVAGIRYPARILSTAPYSHHNKIVKTNSS